ADDCDRERRTLETVAVVDLFFGDDAIADQPLSEASSPCRLLRIERLAKLVPRDPALLEHGETERDAMTMNLGRRAAAIHLAAQRGLHAGARTLRRAGPSSFISWRISSATMSVVMGISLKTLQQRTGQQIPAVDHDEEQNLERR